MKPLFQTTTFTLLLAVSALFAAPHPARADVWGANMAATIAKQAMEVAYAEMQAAILGTLKVTAYELLNTQVGQLIGGTGSSDALIISDWEDFLVSQPRESTALYMNDFFSQSFRGKNTCDYVPVSSSGSDPYSDAVVSSCAAVREGVRFVRNYPAAITDYARRSIGGAVAEGMGTARQYTLDQFCSDPSDMFAAGNWKCWSARHANPYNDHLSYALQAQSAYAQELEKQRQLAQIQGVAYQGYRPQTTPDGRYVVTPGSLIKDIQSSVTDLGNKIIAAANHPGEFLSALITSFVTSYIQQTIRNGVGEIQQHITTAVRDTDRRVSSEINRVVNEAGPAAQYWTLTQSANPKWTEYYQGETGASGGCSGTYADGSPAQGVCASGPTCSGGGSVYVGECSGGNACCAPAQ